MFVNCTPVGYLPCHQLSERANDAKSLRMALSLTHRVPHAPSTTQPLSAPLPTSHTSFYTPTLVRPHSRLELQIGLPQNKSDFILIKPKTPDTISSSFDDYTPTSASLQYYEILLPAVESANLFPYFTKTFEDTTSFCQPQGFLCELRTSLLH